MRAGRIESFQEECGITARVPGATPPALPVCDTLATLAVALGSACVTGRL